MLLRLLFIPLLLLTVTELYSQSMVDYTTKVSDTCWRVDYYVRRGPLFRIESYKDKKKTIAHGRFAFYDDDGWVDSTGFYIDGERNGTWYYYNDKGKLYLSREYNRDVVISEKKHESVPGSKKESLKEGEKEAEFTGGLFIWRLYLQKSLRYPREAINARIGGEVRVAFLVDTTGAVQDTWVFRSAEQSLDKESTRLIEVSPSWTPAVQDGRKVKSYKIQPITYKTPR